METNRGRWRTRDHSVRQTAGEEMCASLVPFNLFAFFPFIYVSGYMFKDLSVLPSGLHFPEVTGYTEPV